MGDECPSAWTQSLTCPDFGAAAAPAAAPAV